MAKKPAADLPKQYDPDLAYRITVNKVIEIPALPHTIFRPTAIYTVKGAVVTALGDALATVAPAA